MADGGCISQGSSEKHNTYTQHNNIYKEINYKELPHAIMDAGKPKIYRVGYQAETQERQQCR